MKTKGIWTLVVGNPFGMRATHGLQEAGPESMRSPNLQRQFTLQTQSEDRDQLLSFGRANKRDGK
jgi:hypothetical protein